MGDQAALQEAIQRARQLAAKISQNAPVKRTASELDDHSSIGTVKVTLAYEKPPNSDNSKRDQRGSSSHRDNNSIDYNRDSSRERDRRDRGRDLDRNSSPSYLSHNNNNNNNNNGNSINSSSVAYGRGGNYSMLGGNGYSGSADDRIEIIIPHAVIGLVIGKGGENIKRIQNETGATVRVDPNTVDEKGNKVCTITGTKQAVEDAHIQVSSVIENSASNKRPRTMVEGSEQYKMKIPASRTGAIIGKGGETIKSIKQQSGCDIELDKNSKECGPDESIFIIRGTQDKILKARGLIEARLASRGRDGDRDRDRDSYRSGGHQSKGVATGANAAPVAPYPDLPAASYPTAAVGQQNSADLSASWAAYFAQYSNLFNQTGAPQAPAGAGMSGYPGQNLINTAGTPQVPQQAEQTIQPQANVASVGATANAPAASTQPQQDYSDQWIEFYLMNGRPDYAEQIIEMKKQQQAQKQQQQ